MLLPIPRQRDRRGFRVTAHLQGQLRTRPWFEPYREGACIHDLRAFSVTLSAALSVKISGGGISPAAFWTFSATAFI
jgi:hypothetical protein